MGPETPRELAMVAVLAVSVDALTEPMAAVPETVRDGRIAETEAEKVVAETVDDTARVEATVAAPLKTAATVVLDTVSSCRSAEAVTSKSAMVALCATKEDVEVIVGAVT
jgi:hypothetical protein